MDTGHTQGTPVPAPTTHTPTPGAIVPVSLHKIVARPVPAEWQLEQRRTGQVAPWIYPGHRKGMVANDLLTFQSLLIISTWVNRPAEERVPVNRPAEERVSHPRVWPNYIDDPQY